MDESPTEPLLWTPSTTPVPAGVPDTGFGAADAECEGTFAGQRDIVLLVWRRTFPVAQLHAFAARLEARGWHGVDQAADGGVYAAPHGLPATYRTGTGRLHYLTINTNRDPALTVLLWL